MNVQTSKAYQIEAIIQSTPLAPVAWEDITQDPNGLRILREMPSSSEPNLAREVWAEVTNNHKAVISVSWQTRVTSVQP